MTEQTQSGGLPAGPRSGAMHRTGRRRGALRTLAAETVCAVTTLRLLARGKLAAPRRLVGHRLRFGDGSTSVIYRETTMRGHPLGEPVLLVVRFRLRLLGLNRVGHALFRLESVLNTLLFAGHPGFATKLWLTDLETGFYRGIYEWEGRTRARRYAEVLRIVLAPFVQAGAFDYVVIRGIARSEFLEGRLPSELSQPPWAVPSGTAAAVGAGPLR